MRIAVLGAGALGTIIGSLIKQGGYNVDLIDVDQKNLDALNQNGAKLSGFLDITIPVTAKHPNELNDEYDVVFLLTKQVYTQSALKSILPFIHEKSIICTLQNGVPEERVESIVGRNRTIGGVVGFGATWLGPGNSELTTELETMKKYAFDVGELNGEITDRIKMIKSILDTVGTCEITTNIQGVKWSKLLMNVTFSGMSAALGCTFGDILNNPNAMKSLANIADETIKVAHSHHIQLAQMQGKDFESLELNDQSDIPQKLEFYHEVWGPHANLKASMLQDLEKRKPTEIDFINGYIVEKGRESNVQTPFNEVVCQLVKEAEKNKEIPDFATNMGEFKSILENDVSALK
ncbi:2-dehydropantoate 2-reductase [Thalassobacillus devorans]|uniref:2-dehydropantoate 2-reductase n=1 Tax=Thalassobacillus devorans TaxID=279813 RepID=A0ABQ1NNW8_9BACI|nr:2-dehydropantoate 2-reductase [Thalassobacillus devorans]NIK27247.1 2-dehydropantoate 2-reductase [Thalassobacillus devorans]GGC76146.1 2-dehydropantoate 2-reductase [Thalassobacillus devorans]